MLKLMKYELRKSRFSKIVMLSALGIAELIFLYGIIFTDPEKSGAISWGVAMLMIVTIVGIAFIGIESLLTLHKDLNTKQSYMLFMTPNSGFKILGAKILENALMIAVTTGFFLILAVIDIGMLMTKIGGFNELFQMIEAIFDIDIPWAEIRLAVILTFCEMVIGWFSMIVTGYLAIILSAAVFAGRKFNGIVTFLLYLILTAVQQRVIQFLTKHVAGMDYQTIGGFVFFGAVSAVFAIGIYIASGILIDKKLSV